MNKSPISWNLSSLPEPNENAPKVVSTFSCGGGSSQGYKRAGCEVVSAVDIDPEMSKQYTLNFPHTQMITKGVSDLTSDEIKSWGKVDIMDGSPPCTLFSTNNNSREDHWGKERMFREGQASQVLDRLFFDYLNLVNIVRPKVFIAENVEGMIRGKTKGYSREVIRVSEEMGYTVTLVLAYASWYRVPQLRPRVFFVGVEGLSAEPFTLPKPWGVTEVYEAIGDLDTSNNNLNMFKPDSRVRKLWKANPEGGRGFRSSEDGPVTNPGFFERINKESITGTICSAGTYAHYREPRNLTPREFARMGTFADDYKFLRDSSSFAQYVIGMSVPPFLSEAVARQAIELYLPEKVPYLFENTLVKEGYLEH